MSPLIGVVLAAVATLVSPPANAHSQTATPAACLDFAGQAEAQAFYEAEGGPASDPHGLDPDRDGRACSAATTPTAPSPSVTVPRGTTPTPTSDDDLPPAGGRGPLPWVGIALAIGGAGLTAFSLLRRRRRPPPPPPPLPPRLDLDDVGW